MVIRISGYQAVGIRISGHQQGSLQNDQLAIQNIANFAICIFLIFS
jgi:hypothetical protein